MIDPKTFSRTPVRSRSCLWFISPDRDAAFAPLGLRRAADNNDLTVVREYSCSGTPTDRNIIRRRVISDLKRGVIGTIIAPNLSTIARTNSELQDVGNTLALAEGRLILTDDNLDTDLSGAQAFANVLLATAMWRGLMSGGDGRSQDISHPVAPVQLSAPAPFGFWWSDGRLEPHPLEAPIRAEAYALFRTLQNLADVATVLNSKGRRLRRKKRFTPTEVRRIIQDPVSMGIFRGNRKPDHKLDPHRTTKSVPVHQIVSEELWKECNSILRSDNGARDAHDIVDRIYPR